MRFSVLDETWIPRFDWQTWEMYDLQFAIDPAAIDVRRIGSGDDSTVMFTDDHDRDRRIGKVIGWDIEANKLYLTTRIGTSDWALRYLEEVAANVEPGKSIEVFVHETTIVEKAEFEGEGWDRKLIKREKRRATRYEIAGLSTVSVPAIGTIGFSVQELMQQTTQQNQVRSQFEKLTLLMEQLETFMAKQSVQTLDVDVTGTEPVAQAVESQPTSEFETIDAASLQAANARIAALELELATQRSERRSDGIAKFLAENSTRLPPAMREFQQMVKFEGGDRQMSLSQFLSALNDPMLEWFKAWVESCFHFQIQSMPVIPPGEFQSKDGSTLDVQELARLAKLRHSQLSQAGTPITYSQALDQIIAEHGVV